MGAPTVSIPRVVAEIEVDGALDEPVWAQAARLTDFWQFQPVDSRPAEERTEVRAWYSPSAIHFGILAYDSQPAAIRATVADRDAVDADDHVIVYLDTFNDRRRAYFFTVNPLGVQQDGVRSEGASSAGSLFGGSIDRNPDFLFDSRGIVTAQGWQAELRIPFKSLRYSGDGPQTWGLNVVRRVQRTGYEDTWTDVRRANASFLLQAGAITGLHDLQRGLTVEVQPFFTASAAGSRDAEIGEFTRQDVDPSGGMNLRLGLTSLSFDGTFNPDFSQVESDASQVTINERFALFYPEKRPFFLEAIELFSTSNQLVYTRRIAEPIAGGKLTGKVGRLGLAYLAAVDQDVDGTQRDALFNVARLRRDLGQNSLLGVTLTDRSVLQSRDFNRVAAGDLRVVFKKLYYAEAQLGGSWTRDGAARLDAPLWKLEADRTGRSFGFNYQVNAIGNDFQSRAGFVPRDDMVRAHAFNRLTWYGARGAWIESFSTFLNPTRVWRYGDFPDRRPVEGSESLDLNLRARGGWEAELAVARNFVRLDAADYATVQTTAQGTPIAYAPLPEVDGPSVSVGLQTPVWRAADAGLELQHARVAIFPEGSQGRESVVEAGVALRPSSSIRVAATTTFAWIQRSRDDAQFARTILPRLKVELQPNRALFFRGVAEYRSLRRAGLEDARNGTPLLVDGAIDAAQASDDLRLDLLVSYEPSPGTVAFLGYGSSMRGQGTLDLTGLTRTTDGLFLKLAYHWRN